MRLTRFLPAVAVTVGLLTLAGAGPRTAAAGEQPSGIRVRGQGVVTARPDIAFLTLGASVRRDTAGEAFNRAQEVTAALTDTLKANGVEERDIQTRQISLSPEFGRPREGEQPPITGWRATNTVTVKLRQIDRIGPIIDASVRALGSDGVVQGISFAIEDTNALAAQARAAALDDARAKAEEIAARAGVRLGRVTYIEETSSPSPRPVGGEARDAALALPAAAPVPAQISPGEQTITVTVDVIYEIG